MSSSKASERSAVTRSRFVIALALVVPALVSAQPPAPIERVTFDEAIARATKNNPSAAIAAAGILRAEGLLAETRSASRLQVNGNVVTTTLNRGVEFSGETVTPRNQLNASLDVRYPLYAPVLWARTAQAEDTKTTAAASADDVRRQIALATADAYLTVIARRRAVEANVVAQETATAHYDLAHELQQRGAGSRLNELRAQQEVSTDEGLVEASRIALYRAQEALGTLLVADGPVDAVDDPQFVIPPDAAMLDVSPTTLLGRTDLKLFAAEQRAAERVLSDSAKDRYPFLEAFFQPSTTYPSQFFLPQNSWRLLMQLSVPIFDSGQRAGLELERQANVDSSRATFARAITSARAEVRTGRAAVASAERELASASAAADQARQVVTIVNVSFRAGGATNIEVVDAQRRARNADLAVAIAEDTLRRARLELLTALGRFP
jgi:outer membrane protein TolC